MLYHRIFASLTYECIKFLVNERYRQGLPKYADDKCSGYSFRATKHRHFVLIPVCTNIHGACCI